MAAKEVGRPPAGTDKPRRRASWMVWMVAAVVVVATVAIVVSTGRPPEGLPPPPDLTGRPAAFRDAVLAADANARSWFAKPATIADLGRVYHANGFDREAEVCWKLMSREQPAEGRWPYYLADIARNSADNESMVAYLKEALVRAPDYSPGWLRLADNAFKTADFVEAEKDYQHRVALAPGDPYARFGLIRIEFQRSHTADGKRDLEAFVRDTPEFPSAQNFYAELLAREGDEKGAERHRWLGTVAERFREADDPWLLELRPHCFDSRQLAVWASQEAQTKHLDRARELFERAIAVSPEDPVPYAELGQLLSQQGEQEKACEVFERGIVSAPFNQKLFLRLSQTLRKLGRSQAALENDQRGLALSPDSFALIDSLGQSQAELGRTAEAEDAFRKSMKIAPNEPAPQINLAQVMLKTGHREEARRMLEAIFASNPGEVNVLVTLGKMDIEDGRLDDAERMIQPFFDQYPGSVTAKALFAQLHLERAKAALAAGDTAAAERWCTLGIEHVPDSAELLGFAGAVYLKGGNVQKAIEVMEACQRIRPGDPHAVLPLALLYQKLNRPADARRILLEAREWLVRNGGDKVIPKIDMLLKMTPGG